MPSHSKTMCATCGCSDGGQATIHNDDGTHTHVGPDGTLLTLSSADGSYVLTLYEHHSDDELDFMLGLQQHLAAREVACPAPLKDRRGALFSMLNQRPAAIIHRLPGQVVKQPSVRHCALIGAELAAFHLQGTGFGGT